MPRISILMSVYNGEKYLREAIESILNQTFEDFEFIIFNDKSTDGSREIILSYNDSRIKLVDNEENIGLTRSLNIGLRMSTGEYIARMDADDIALPQRFEKQIDFLDKNKDIMVVGAWMEIFYDDGRNGYVVKHSTDQEAIKWESLFKNQITHSLAFFRREVFEKYEYFYDEHYKYAQDFDLWFRVSRKHKITNLPKVLLKYRIHGQRLSDLVESGKKQKQFVSEIIFNNINYYIGLNRDDFNVFMDAFKNGRIFNFKSLIGVRKIYKNLFNSYKKKENLSDKEIKKIYPIYKKNLNFTLTWYLKGKFFKNSLRNL